MPNDFSRIKLSNLICHTSWIRQVQESQITLRSPDQSSSILQMQHMSYDLMKYTLVNLIFSSWKKVPIFFTVSSGDFLSMTIRQLANKEYFAVSSSWLIFLIPLLKLTVSLKSIWITNFAFQAIPSFKNNSERQ